MINTSVEQMAAFKLGNTVCLTIAHATSNYPKECVVDCVVVDCVVTELSCGVTCGVTCVMT